MTTYVIKLRKGKGKFFLLLLILLLSCISCRRSTLLVFEDFDANNDNKITREEFTSAFTATFFEEWDSDKDNLLSDEDFMKVSFHMWDSNKDQRLSLEEWNRGYDHFYQMAGNAGYDEMDNDHDSLVIFSEFSKFFDSDIIFIDWDFNSDQFLDVTEFATGIFLRWDLDQNDTLDREEYRKFEHEYLDI